MNLNANLYDRTNHYQYERAVKLINKIVADNKNRNFGIILDIGCGSGNVTALLNNTLRPELIIAIDLKDNFVKYAQTNHSEDNVKYLSQDITVGWAELAPELRHYAGRVDLVFSNFVFHWFENRDSVAENLYRLLADGGLFYATIGCIPDPLGGALAGINGRMFISVPSSKAQVKAWRKVFADGGLSVREIKVESDQIKADLVTHRASNMQLLLQLWMRYVVDDEETDRAVILQKYSKILFDEFEKRLCVKYYDRMVERQMIEFSGDIMVVCLEKR